MCTIPRPCPGSSHCRARTEETPAAILGTGFTAAQACNAPDLPCMTFITRATNAMAACFHPGIEHGNWGWIFHSESVESECFAMERSEISEGPRFGSRLNCKSTDATSAANMIQNVQEKMF